MVVSLLFLVLVGTVETVPQETPDVDVDLVESAFDSRILKIVPFDLEWRSTVEILDPECVYGESEREREYFLRPVLTRLSFNGRDFYYQVFREGATVNPVTVFNRSQDTLYLANPDGDGISQNLTLGPKARYLDNNVVNPVFLRASGLHFPRKLREFDGLDLNPIRVYRENGFVLSAVPVDDGVKVSCKSSDETIDFETSLVNENAVTKQTFYNRSGKITKEILNSDFRKIGSDGLFIPAVVLVRHYQMTSTSEVSESPLFERKMDLISATSEVDSSLFLPDYAKPGVVVLDYRSGKRVSYEVPAENSKLEDIVEEAKSERADNHISPSLIIIGICCVFLVLGVVWFWKWV